MPWDEMLLALEAAQTVEGEQASGMASAFAAALRG